MKPEHQSISGIWNTIGFEVEATLFEIGFACVTAVRIDGREPLKFPREIPRAHTLGQALDWGFHFAIYQIEPDEGRPFRVGW